MSFEILSLNFAARLIATIVAMALLLGVAYPRQNRVGASLFLFCTFGLGVFFVTYTLKLQEMSLGFAFGLFAIFSMLRYRTELMGIRDMTYLFLVIVLALLGAVSPLSLVELPLMLLLLVLLLVIAEKVIQGNELCQQTVRYERIENIKLENRPKLLADLAERTGLQVTSVKIDSVDFLQDSAMLTVIYKKPASKD